MPKLYCWDIETSDLNANDGIILCTSVADVAKDVDKVKTFRLDKYKGWKKDPWNDYRLVRDVANFLSDADTWITYYGAKFDVPYLHTRIVYWNARLPDGDTPIPVPTNIPHVDLYRTAKHRLKLHRNSLAMVTELLGNGEKVHIPLSVWRRASGGDRGAMEQIVHRCEEDVRILGRDYMDLRPLVPAHPHRGLLSGVGLESCANCGSNSVRRRGTYVAVATKRQRFVCTDCGRWGSIPYREPRGV